MLTILPKKKPLIFLFFIALTNLGTYSGVAQKTSATFDFSTVKKFKDTKLNGTIINDYDSIFTTKQHQELSNLLYDYHSKITRQVVVVTIDTMKPYTHLQKFGTDLGNYWGVGSQKNNGLIILVCVPYRQVSIVTGLATEKILTDRICKLTIQNIIIPEFKKGKFYEGVSKGIKALIHKWDE